MLKVGYLLTFDETFSKTGLRNLDLAEHDLVPSVVELHRAVVAHGVVAAEVNALLQLMINVTELTPKLLNHYQSF
jgi:hypothetical protein